MNDVVIKVESLSKLYRYGQSGFSRASLREALTDAARSTVHGPRCTVHGPRSTVHGPRSTVHGPRFTVHGPRFTVYGPRSTVHGSRPQVLGIQRIPRNRRLRRDREVHRHAGCRDGAPYLPYSSGMYVRLAFGVAAHLAPEILLVVARRRQA